MADVRRVELQDATWADDRGWVVSLLEVAGVSREHLGDLHVVSLRPGKTRGNHYHAGATEWILVCGGPAKVAWRSRDEGSFHEVLVNGTEPVLFEIPRNVEHAVLNESGGDVCLMSFSNPCDRKTVRCNPLFDLIKERKI